MQNKILLTLLAMLILVPAVLSYTASNGQLNITISDSYNSYSEESGNLNATFSPSQQSSSKEQNNLNITMSFSFNSPPSSSGSTTTASTTVAPTSTSQPSSGGGGGGGGGSSGRDIVYIDRPAPVTEIIREIIREPQIIYRETVNNNPYRLSSVLLVIIMIILLSIRIGDIINQRRQTPEYQYSKMLKKEIKSKLKQGYTKEQIFKAAKKAKWPEDQVRESLEKL